MNEKLRERVLYILDRVYRADPNVAHALMEYRVEVKDPTEMPEEVVLLKDPGEPHLLGLLGVLNGILGPDFKINAVYNDEGLLTGFQPHRFVPTRK